MSLQKYFLLSLIFIVVRTSYGQELQPCPQVDDFYLVVSIHPDANVDIDTLAVTMWKIDNYLSASGPGIADYIILDIIDSLFIYDYHPNLYASNMHIHSNDLLGISAAITNKLDSLSIPPKSRFGRLLLISDEVCYADSLNMFYQEADTDFKDYSGIWSIENNSDADASKFIHLLTLGAGMTPLGERDLFSYKIITYPWIIDTLTPVVDFNNPVNGLQSFFEYKGLRYNDTIDIDNDFYAAKCDCDDANENINPGLFEILYNGIDDDCDPRTVDDDFDGDGFGINEDCNDLDASINPVAIDIPNNGIDEDCDGMDEISSNSELPKAFLTKVYPNPTTGPIYIHASIECEFYELLNSQIQIVSKGAFQKALDFTKLPAGIYVLKLITNNEIKSKKIVIR